ncbi:MAG: hypothetical protein ACXWNX_10820, partial [Isosphaeraceae bacterium]
QRIPANLCCFLNARSNRTGRPGPARLSAPHRGPVCPWGFHEHPGQVNSIAPVFLRIVKHRFKAKLLTSVLRDQCRNCDQSYLSSSDDSCSLELHESDGQEFDADSITEQHAGD